MKAACCRAAHGPDGLSSSGQLHAGCKQLTSHQSGAIFQENIGKSSKMIYKCWSFYGFSMDFLDLLVSLQQGFDKCYAPHDP